MTDKWMEHLTPRVRELVKNLRSAAPLMDTPEFTKIGVDAGVGLANIFYSRACTSLDDEEATRRMNLEPSGTQNGWTLCKREHQLPVPCDDKPDTHRHLMFEC